MNRKLNFSSNSKDSRYDEPEEKRMPIKAEVCEETEGEDKFISDLYPDHVVKDEMVIGPERLQPADITYTLQANMKPTPGSECDEQSRGTGECSDVNPSPDCVRPSQTQVCIKTELIEVEVPPIKHELRCVWECSEYCSEADHCSGDRHDTQKPEKPPDPVVQEDDSCCALWDCDVKLERQTDHERIKERAQNGKPYSCGICKHTFTRLSNLNKHKRVHTGERPYACSMCDKKFKELNDLKRHGLVHSVEKPFSCEMCDKRFTQASHFKRHERVHTGERPYSCSACEKKFKELSHLKIHIRVHSGEMPYSCEICNQRFRQASNLKRHKWVHSGEKPHACNICDKKFVDHNSLKKHSRVHSGERPYSCDICDWKFAQLNYLNTHKLIHEDVKPYCCDICDKKFRNSFKLKRHRRIHDKPLV